jgi:ABC-type antimicrobial peptide transport system permease subunit
MIGEVLRRGLGMTMRGIAIGAGLAWALSRLLVGFLYGVAPTDPVVFIGGSLFVAAVAALAAYLPARRAARLDPLVALRHE